MSFLNYFRAQIIYPVSITLIRVTWEYPYTNVWFPKNVREKKNTKEK